MQAQSAEPPTPEIAQGYFVDCNSGDDTAAGTSFTTPWKSLSKANEAITASGADLWIKSGTTCALQTLTVNWDGSPNNHVVVGSYYVNQGIAYRGYDGSQRAVIRGTYDTKCSRTLNPSLSPGTLCKVNTPSAVPATLYGSLVTLNCNYCELRDIHTIYSAGVGVALNKTDDYLSPHHDVWIVNNVADVSAKIGMTMNTGYNVVFTGNTITQAGIAGSRGGDDIPSAGRGEGLNIGNFLTDKYAPTVNTNILMENNTISMTYGEGSIISNVGSVIVRGNRVGTSFDAALYAQTCVNCVWEYNVVWGGTPTGASNPVEYGIGLVPEDAYISNPNESVVFSGIIRGNMVAHSSNCIRLGMEPQGIARGLKYDVKVYNNTCVNMASGTSAAANMTAANVIRIEYRNNIFYNETGGTLCRMPSVKGISFDYSLWGATPDDPICRGAHDATGNPLLTASRFNEMTSFTTPPVVGDFALRAGSPAIAKGIPLGNAVLSAPSISANVSYPCATFDLKGGAIDAECKLRNAAPNMGALANTGERSVAYNLTVD